MNIKEVEEIDDVIDCEKPLFYKPRMMRPRSDYSHSFPSGWVFPPAIPKKKAFEDGKIQQILRHCCEEHPGVVVEDDILGGMPHIQNTRISVGYILDRLYVLGNTQAVTALFAPDITEEHIKEAIAYTQDFLEKACGSIQNDD